MPRTVLDFRLISFCSASEISQVDHKHGSSIVPSDSTTYVCLHGAVPQTPRREDSLPRGGFWWDVRGILWMPGQYVAGSEVQRAVAYRTVET